MQLKGALRIRLLSRGKQLGGRVEKGFWNANALGERVMLIGEDESYGLNSREDSDCVS